VCLQVAAAGCAGLGKAVTVFSVTVLLWAGAMCAAVYASIGSALPPSTPIVRARMSFQEQEEIAIRHATGESARQIAAALDRDPATISRELARNRTGQGYRATVAQSLTDARAHRPKDRKLSGLRLRRKVRAMLGKRFSPEQIAARLKLDYPDDPEMHVSHETIYQAIYVQGRGALRAELASALRTGRALRKPHGRTPGTGSKIKDMVNDPPRSPTGPCPATGKAT
jgi:IS30 family transposase